MSAANPLDQVRSEYPQAVPVVDGVVTAVLLPNMKFRAAGAEQQMDLLLYPGQHGGYISRLFFKEKIEGCAANWNQFAVGGRTWWAPSWNNVPPTMPMLQMLGAHLRAVA